MLSFQNAVIPNAGVSRSMTVQVADIARPASLDKALALLRDGHLKPFAGGTDFMVGDVTSAASGAAALCLSGISELHDIVEDGQSIVLGALVTHAQVVASQVARRFVPLLVEGCATVGSSQIREVGTLGGNIANASPAADSVPPLVALGAEVEIMSSSGRRVLPLEDYATGPGASVLENDELLTRIVLPKMAPDEQFSYRKLGRRKAVACSVASLAVRFTFDYETRRCSRPAVAFGAVAPTVRRSPELEAALCEEPLDEARILSLSERAGEYCSPISDIRASARYRVDMCSVLLRQRCPS